MLFRSNRSNEYENNVNNNFYTNYIAKWCLEYTYDQIQKYL
jgi:maltose phosphorylase